MVKFSREISHQKTKDDKSSCSSENKLSSRKRKQLELKLKNMSDVRKEKVKYLKEKINAGEYHVEEEEVAKKIMDHIGLE